MWPRLFDDPTEALAAWQAERDLDAGNGPEDDGDAGAVEVKVFAESGDGLWWVAEATPSRITIGATWTGVIGAYDDIEWEDEPRTVHREAPAWAVAALAPNPS